MARFKTKLPVQDVADAIKKYRGNISRVSEHFGVERSVIYLKIRSRPTLVQAQHDAKEERKDRIERGFDEAIDRGERWAIALGLTLLCRDRGYIPPKIGGLGAFGDGEGQINTVNVNGVTITAIEHNEFAQSGTESVRITAIAPPPEPEDADDSLVIEGQFTEADDDQ